MDKLQVVASAILLVLFAGGLGFWLGRTYAPLAPVGPTATEAEGEPAAGGAPVSSVIRTGGNAIAVNDQPAGMAVSIDLAVLANDGWVVIHRDVDGKPAGILGAQRLAAGSHQSVTVELLTPTEEGRVYYAMLHGDAPSEPHFDKIKDLPITDGQGNPIMMRFVATSRPRTQ